MWSQILLDTLIYIPPSSDETNKDLIDELRRLCRNDPFRLEQIDKFEENYVPTDAYLEGEREFSKIIPSILTTIISSLLNGLDR